MLTGATVGDRYDVQELAGSGGMASVYRGVDRETGGQVAVKVLSTTEPGDLARFDREARVLSDLVHPHIVGYRGRGVTAEGRPYLVLDWLEGATLGDRLATAIPSVDESIAMMAIIASATGHAHGRGVVHRDLKPSNVFLVGPGFDDPRVLDFGVARLLAATRMMTRSGTAIGTPAYMAPEQARGRKDVDARADVYALGCLLFECVTGRAPFEGDDVMAVLAKVLFDEAPRIARFLPSVPEELDALVARLLAKDPADRPANGLEVARLLTSLGEEMVEAAPRPHGTSSLPPRPLTTHEQRLVAVVAARRYEGDAPPRGPDSPTLESDAHVSLEGLAADVGAFGARFAALADGSAIAFLEGAGSAVDLALRSARCALALREAQPGLRLALAIGRSASGRVPVGEVIDRVSELLPRAKPGTIRMDGLARDLLEHRYLVATDDRGAELLGELDAPAGPRLVLGRASPFVGRSREIRMIDSLYEECRGEGVASAAVVTGVAGIGKSRIVSEWLRTLDDHTSRWLGRGDPLVAGSPLSLVASTLRGALGLGTDERGDDAVARVSRRVARHLRGADAARVAAFLGEIVGLPFPDAGDQELRAARADRALMGDQLTRAFEDFVFAEATAGPLVMVIEDAHWGDAASVRLLEAVLRHARALPLFLVIVGRPETTTAFPSLTGLRGALHLVVGDLAAKHCRAFVDGMLGAEADPSTKDRVVSLSAGNAFFLEELVRFVADARGDRLPATVVAMVQSRLEALPSEVRRVLRAASVFGNTFWIEGVTALLGQVDPSSTATLAAPASRGRGEADARRTDDRAMRLVLDRLLAEELIDLRGASRLATQQEAEFRHAFVRDAAYEMLTERDRAAGHRLAAEWLQKAGEPDPLVLAEHFERGGARARAAACAADAAAHALGRHDFLTALALSLRARSAGGSAEALVGRLSLIESEAHRWMGNLAEAERAAEVAHAALPAGTAPWFAAAEQLATLAGVHSDYRPAVLWRERIARVPFRAEAAGARLLALCAVGRRLFQLGDYATDEVVDFVDEERLRLGDAIEPSVLAEVERLLGARARHRGDVATDLARYAAALAAYERAGDVRGSCNALVSVGFAYLQVGDHAAARSCLDRARERATRLGLLPLVTRADQNLSLLSFAEGRPAEAASLAERVAAEARDRGDERFEGWTRVYLSRFRLALGEPRVALEEANRALPLLAGSPPAYAGALAVRSLALLACGDAVEADVVASEALAILEEYEGIEEFEPLVLLASLRAARAVDDAPRAAAIGARARGRLALRRASLSDPAHARSFVERVPENAELAAACDEASRADRATEAALSAPPASAVEAWSPAAFREDAAWIVPRLAAHLEDAITGAGSVTRGFPGPAELLARTAPGFSEGPQLDLASFVEHVLARSPWQHHPRYVGHQVSAAIPRAALLGLVAQVLNNGMAAFESGPALSALERRVVEWMLGLLSWERGGGVLTSGGSLGNLTALLAARQAKAPVDVREAGQGAGPALAILACEHVHYSIERAAQVMGLGRAAVVPIATDARYRMIPSDARAAVRRATDRGLVPFALVASAGATGTGAIDPLEDAADVAADQGLWLHVDGAHGASALLSPRYAPALRGIERADSLVWDAHKLMSMPALATAVLFRDDRAPYATFAQKAEYLFEDRAEPPWFDIGLRTVECTKPLIALSLYGCLATLGTRVFTEAVERAHDLARAFAAQLAAAPDFELACEPDSNIVCFRFVPSGASDVEALQRRIRDALRESGAFYCVATTLRGRSYLRVTLMNPLTTLPVLEALVEEIRRVGAAAQAGC